MVKKFGGTKVLIPTAEIRPKKSDCWTAVEKTLRMEGIDIVQLGGVLPNPRSGLVYEGIKLCREEGVLTLSSPWEAAASSIRQRELQPARNMTAISGISLNERPQLKRRFLLGQILTIPASGSEGTGNGHYKGRRDAQGARQAGHPCIRNFRIMNPR